MAEATLDELRAARDQILIGRSVVTIASGGRSVTYGPANLAALERRIRELEANDGARPVSIVAVRSEKGW
jgi:hypothetical protein